ncbi:MULTISPECIES: amino acid ABC transporter permease [Lactobacillales]|jgi:putative amino-acid transport system permease protein|uniref:Amino acid ABC transporter permease n=1 Tax=Aerococcus urinaeequi TaxID=51665 RepID=A0AAE9XMR0_9LACT|nr:MULTISPECIES: amino acid ABC transporter permease [Lactobacillales]KAF3300072.1 ABC transporter permease subunit [Carnobacterium sp. PL26RED25]KAF3304772.1 ABC transporter permease subunit [Carnobacterium sp. PL24RED07]MBR2129926.1 amino acid ABC transporter permease [Aerococcus sp.]WCG38121.1 amino acid ABC transporter permease [Aerococcus urinaeequi]
MTFDFAYMMEILPDLLGYLPITLYLTLASMAIAVIIGGLFSVVLVNKVPVLTQIIQVIMSFFRGTPPIVQLLLIYFGLPQILPIATGMSAETASILTFSLNTAAYLAEVFRAALVSVDEGQVEAAMTVGLTYGQTLRGIVLPQAVRNAIPGTGNTFVGLLKNSSLAFTIGVVELLAQGKLFASNSLKFFEAYFAVALIYWALTILYSLLQNWYEKRLAVPYTR